MIVSAVEEEQGKEDEQRGWSKSTQIWPKKRHDPQPRTKQEKGPVKVAAAEEQREEEGGQGGSLSHGEVTEQGRRPKKGTLFYRFNTLVTRHGIDLLGARLVDEERGRQKRQPQSNRIKRGGPKRRHPKSFPATQQKQEKEPKKVLSADEEQGKGGGKPRRQLEPQRSKGMKKEAKEEAGVNRKGDGSQSASSAPVWTPPLFSRLGPDIAPVHSVG